MTNLPCIGKRRYEAGRRLEVDIWAIRMPLTRPSTLRVVGPLCRLHRGVRTLLALRDAIFRLARGEAIDGRRAREGVPGRKDRQRRDERHSVLLHDPARLVVDLHAVLDAVDAGLRGDAGAG